MAYPNYGFLSCARDCNNPQAILQLFENLTPQECAFQPTNIWSRQTKRKKKPCLWCVLYTARDPRTPCLRGPQGRQLRTEINKCKPFNGEIVDYKFYENDQTGQVGWLFIWKNLQCSHQPKKSDIAHKGMPTILCDSIY